jgi:hypothetical protein
MRNREYVYVEVGVNYGDFSVYEMTLTEEDEPGKLEHYKKCGIVTSRLYSMYKGPAYFVFCQKDKREFWLKKMKDKIRNLAIRHLDKQIRAVK